MNHATVVISVAAPAAVAVLAVVSPWRVAAWSSVAAALAVLVCGIGLARDPEVSWGPVRVDALSVFVLLVIGAVATVACAAGITHLSHEMAAAAVTTAGARHYVMLVMAFITCMVAAVITANLGIMWVAIEATTIVTAFLVGYRRTRASVEAAWKYVVLCSAGIAIAFLGLVCLYAAAIDAGAHGLQALDWMWLREHANALDPGLVRLATGLLLVGFGTKAGLAPMHAWLPDAHSQAPPPVSALMSGVLLSVAFYAIWRTTTITAYALGPSLSRALLMIAALGSLSLAALLLIGQRDYKRMLAYSSIEHMGLIALGTAIGGPVIMAAVLLHVLGHGLTKATAFCAAGRIIVHTGDSRIRRFALAHNAPVTAAIFGAAVVGLLGLPPFSLFASEIAIARTGVASGFGWAIAAAFALLVVAFVAIVRHTTTMLLGTAPAGVVRSQDHAPGALHNLPLYVALATAAALGIWIGPLQHLLTTAAAIAGGR